MPLRSYQQAAVRAIYKGFGQHGSVLCSMATGTGKSWVLAHVACEAARRGWRVWCLVHRDELLKQLVKTIERTDRRSFPGVIQGDTIEADRRICVAMVPTLSKERLVELREVAPRLIITDEAHHASAPTYQRIYKWARSIWPGTMHLGMTATPYRSRADGGSVDLIKTTKTFNKLVFEFGLVDAINAGVLVPEVRAIRIPLQAAIEHYTGDRLKSAHARRGWRSQATLERERVRDTIIVRSYLGLTPGRPPGIFFCEDVAHAKALARRFQELHITAQPVWGGMDTELGEGARENAIANYRRGQTHVLTTVDVLTEGFDAPATAVVGICRTQRSLVSYLQILGRAIRPAPGKAQGTLLDFYDVTPGLDLTPAGLEHLVRGATVSRKGVFQYYSVRRQAPRRAQRINKARAARR